MSKNEVGTITKTSLVETIAASLPNEKKKNAHQIVAHILNLISATASSDEEVRITKFGNFSVKQTKPRKGRNPATGAPLDIAARRVLRFRASAVLKAKLNKF